MRQARIPGNIHRQAYADYTTPERTGYISSNEIVRSASEFERKDAHGLNGCVLLIHPGTDPARRDKGYDRLPEIIGRLRGGECCFQRL